MKNYYFDENGNPLEEVTEANSDRLSYLFISNVNDFKTLCDNIGITDDGITKTGVYCWNECKLCWNIKSPLLKEKNF